MKHKCIQQNKHLPVYFFPKFQIKTNKLIFFLTFASEEPPPISKHEITPIFPIFYEVHHLVTKMFLDTEIVLTHPCQSKIKDLKNVKSNSMTPVSFFPQIFLGSWIRQAFSVICAWQCDNVRGASFSVFYWYYFGKCRGEWL